MAPEVIEHLAATDPNAPEPWNLWRINWYNPLSVQQLASGEKARSQVGQALANHDSQPGSHSGVEPAERGALAHCGASARGLKRGSTPAAPSPLNPGQVFVSVPDHVVLPEELTGVKAKIVVALGDRFPMIGAHKVLPAYACLVTRLVAGKFDPMTQRAVWPSTGNYARGGIAISRILGCRGVAVLPAGMSKERFDWLESWVADPADIVRTPGSESNVKEIYDACARLAADPDNVILNQFSEMPNYVAHYAVTGPALQAIFADLEHSEEGLRLRAFVSASGSSGTLGAGDYLKERHGSLTAVIEALECPTLLYNGYGEHNIQGIGDKHVPLIHNVMGTDVVMAISDRSTDALDAVFALPEGRSLLADRGVSEAILKSLDSFGLSSIANILGSIKLAKAFALGPKDVIVTVATDSARMYSSERPERLGKLGLGGPAGSELDTSWPRHRPADELARSEQLARLVGEHLDGVRTDHFLELKAIDKKRIFNLGYFTWVEQQGVTLEEFEARRDPSWWVEQRAQAVLWDEQISELNAAVSAAH